MKNILFKLFIVTAWIYCLGYIIFGFSTETFIMRAVKGIMSIVFSGSLLFFLIKIIDKKQKKVPKE